MLFELLQDLIGSCMWLGLGVQGLGYRCKCEDSCFKHLKSRRGAGYDRPTYLVWLQTSMCLVP